MTVVTNYTAALTFEPLIIIIRALHFAGCSPSLSGLRIMFFLCILKTFLWILHIFLYFLIDFLMFPILQWGEGCFLGCLGRLFCLTVTLQRKSWDQDFFLKWSTALSKILEGIIPKPPIHQHLRGVAVISPSHRSTRIIGEELWSAQVTDQPESSGDSYDQSKAPIHLNPRGNSYAQPKSPIHKNLWGIAMISPSHRYTKVLGE